MLPIQHEVTTTRAVTYFIAVVANVLGVCGLFSDERQAQTIVDTVEILGLSLHDTDLEIDSCTVLT